MGRHLRIVALGGGSGPSLVARAFADHLQGITAVVCTTDTGSSTGTCRRLFRMPGPGDLRATLGVLAELSGRGAWARLLAHRFRAPGSRDLDGMALGNLVLAALFEEDLDFEEAVARACRLVGIRGRLLPATADPVQIRATLADGSSRIGEAEVRALNKPSIERLGWSGHPPRPGRGVLEALARARLIVMGPGCLYTSVLPCLLVEGVAEAVRASRGLRVYICNTTTTPGQTDGFTAARHVEAVLGALGGRGLDAVVLHRGDMDASALGAYRAMGVIPLAPPPEEVREILNMGVRPVLADVAELPRSIPRKLHKRDTLRHDPGRLRAALDALMEGSR